MNYPARRRLFRVQVWAGSRGSGEQKGTLPELLLIIMTDSQTDADGFTEEVRYFIVHSALDRVLARGFKPKAYVLAIYDQYIAGTISRKESSNLLSERLERLYGKGSGAGIK